MITFIISLIALIVGYFVYGRVVEHIFAPDNRPTPAISMSDGVDYVVLPGWKIFMIQFLNIAGTGPIFGAIMGAKFGPSAYLWIVLGCIFAGAVHDYLSGMLSVRHGGAGLPELVGIYLGRRTKKVMLVFSIFLLLMVGAVFVYSPALILGNLCGDSLTWVYAWCVIIFAYYFLATMLPIDKIIGKIYPFFAIAMLFMAVARRCGGRNPSCCSPSLRLPRSRGSTGFRAISTISTRAVRPQACVLRCGVWTVRGSGSGLRSTPPIRRGVSGRCFRPPRGMTSAEYTS